MRTSTVSSRHSKMLTMSSTLLTLSFCIYLSLNSVAISPNYYWRDYIPGEIPCDAISGDSGRYIGQVNYDGNIVATIYSSSNIAMFELYGRKNSTKNIKILCSHRPSNFFWQSIDINQPSNQQLNNILKGGYQDYQNHDLYIGKVYHEGEWKIGKVVANTSHPDKGIWVWTSSGNNARYYQFHILKFVPTSCECATSPWLSATRDSNEEDGA